ncbi:MAG: family 65 glycosyl hydrolase domain-containing protein [Actinomycetota bacterium]
MSTMLSDVEQLTEIDPWQIVQNGFRVDRQRVYESLFSLGNGYFGGRGNHEERYSGDSLRGNYLAGVFYPDPTRVGWWKNGYPDYFAKVLNAADWTPIHVSVDGIPLDLATAEIHEFRRLVDMRTAELTRTFRATVPEGPTVEVEAVRFVSLVRRHGGAIRYRITPVDADVALTVSVQVDGDVVNEDSNYDEGFWDEVSTSASAARGVVVSRTKATKWEVEFDAATAMAFEIRRGGDVLDVDDLGIRHERRARFVEAIMEVAAGRGQTVEVTKFAANVTSRDAPGEELEARCHEELDGAVAAGFDQLRTEHRDAWTRKWETSDVVIEGDPAAQQGIRFNIFQLNSTFTGDDPDLNIGPKGFTGEKYGGVTYWDTEAFCLPFYLATSEQEVSKNLLRYRHRQLGEAIENAAKLGFSGGAALFPMVTVNGHECHNEWEITFEEIHRNGAIAFAIFNYLRHTGDEGYLLEGGLEVLVAISRFWVQRVSWSEPKQAWVMLGVTGPNEYENNVDNNWYTSLMAQWTLRYTADAIDRARQLAPDDVSAILDRLDVDETVERERWNDVADRLHLPEDPERGVFLQQSNYLEKELLTVDDLDPSDRPLNQNWSWDRILRSCFIKQADVLQGLWVFEDRYDLATIERNFDFYEPRTVHESSLSPSVHAVLAVRLGRREKAREMMLRTARLDLDNVNNDTDDGCHTTSMAGTWIATVLGFGGMRVIDGALHLDPTLAPGWSELRFQIRFRGAWLSVSASASDVTVENHSDRPTAVVVAGRAHEIAAGSSVTVAR